MQIARVFTRRTAATPNDALAALAFTTPQPQDLPDIGAVHVSVALTYDNIAVMLLNNVIIRSGFQI